jgi:hypothetical protein
VRFIQGGDSGPVPLDIRNLVPASPSDNTHQSSSRFLRDVGSSWQVLKPSNKELWICIVVWSMACARYRGPMQHFNCPNDLIWSIWQDLIERARQNFPEPLSQLAVDTYPEPCTCWTFWAGVSHQHAAFGSIFPGACFALASYTADPVILVRRKSG